MARAVERAAARAGFAVMLDGKTGEILAMASLPTFDPNRPGDVDEQARRNRVSGARYEIGSTLKPLTVAMAMQDGKVRLTETFTPSAALNADGVTLRDPHPQAGEITVRQALAHSSNVVMAELALRVGGERQRALLDQLGLISRLPVELAERVEPSAPPRVRAEDIARLGYGHGLEISLLQLAGAYTVFVNQGDRSALTIVKHVSGDPLRRTRVFSPLVAQETLSMMREAVVTGTGKGADIDGLDIAGKTGTAEIYVREEGRYSSDRQVASFIAVFPTAKPRYVIALALEEPARTAVNEGLATGGAVAAPAVGRIAARVAPFLGLSAAAP
jgi:cell division protein FtsI (penicillin-binding protein 3)